MRDSALLRPIVNDDLTGFRFGNYHTSQFGLVRVSNGSRYSEYLSPTFKNTTIDALGAEGTLYFGRQDTTRTFQIDLAFDSITEAELRDIKEWLNSGVQELVFDERPYVAYYCTLSAAPQVKYLTFYENYVRIYKGEISVNFISYYPYGFSVDGYKFADDFTDGNFDEWAEASRLVNREFTITEDSATITYNYDELKNNKIYVYNSGDFDTDFTLEFSYTGSGTITITYDGDTNATIEFSLPAATESTTVKLNTKLQILYVGDNITAFSKFNFNKIAQGRHVLSFTSAATISDGSMNIGYKNKFW